MSSPSHPDGSPEFPIISAADLEAVRALLTPRPPEVDFFFDTLDTAVRSTVASEATNTPDPDIVDTVKARHEAILESSGQIGWSDVEDLAQLPIHMQETQADLAARAAGYVANGLSDWSARWRAVADYVDEHPGTRPAPIWQSGTKPPATG